MNNRKYEDLKEWEKAFFDLNEKLGNEVWGARLEGDGRLGHRLHIFIDNQLVKIKVLNETGGKIYGYPIIFTEFLQEKYTVFK